MPVRDRNPFAPGDEEPSKADVGVTDPFERPQSVIKCPMCGERDPEKITTHNTPSQILRGCKTCNNRWSCGNVGGAYMTPVTEDMMRPAQPEDVDLPEDIRLSGTDRWFSDD